VVLNTEVDPAEKPAPEIPSASAHTAIALLLEDDPGNLEALAEFVGRAGFRVCAADTLEKARRELAAQRFDLLIADVSLPDGSGLDLLGELEAGGQTLDVVFVTGHASVASAVQAFRGGAVDYLTKPIDLRRLQRILEGARRKAELQGQVATLRQELRDLGRFGKMVGASPQMQEVYNQVQRVAPAEATVFVSGETGTGKELVAETVHALSNRARGPFVPVNCGAISPNLIESELFGHERGSFTGAAKRHQGFFERAAGGSLFLDEISEMPIELQVKLLRALEAGTIQRVGGHELIETDVRVIAATNRDPHQSVTKGILREDLLYRLLVFPIRLPALAERDGDVELLAFHFLGELNRAGHTSKRWSDEALTVLRDHSWPGNVRELRNVVERAYIMGGERIAAECVPLTGHSTVRRSHSGPLGPGLAIQTGMSIAEAERILVLATLESLGGDRRAAARQLGMSLKTLYNRLSRYRALNSD
jgi:two-component system response regulator AtoC